MAASVELFSTSILSNIKVRSRHERFVSVLTVKRVPYIYHDLASDEDAKSRWRRKARDPQIPGLLVNNEWRGTFEEFEEAVEFGELDLFLRVDDGKPSATTAAPPLPAPAAEQTGSALNASIESGSAPNAKSPATSKHLAPVGLAKPRSISDRGPLPAPTVPLPHAPAGAGKREEVNLDDLIESFDTTSLDLNDDDVDAMLAEISALSLSDSKRREAEREQAKAQAASASADAKKRGLYPQLGVASQSPVPRTYVPSANAGMAPLKLAKMGSSSTSAPRSVSESPSSSSDTSGSRLARYNASQMSSKALAAEASSAALGRGASSAAIAKMFAEGGSLSEALAASRSESIVGHEDADALLASLGLADIQLTPEEAEAFITHGTVPEGAASGGSRLKRVGSKAERVRDEVGAREVARRARERGAGGSISSMSSLESARGPSQTKGPQQVLADTIDVAPVAASEVSSTSALTPEMTGEDESTVVKLDSDAGEAAPEVESQRPKEDSELSESPDPVSASDVSPAADQQNPSSASTDPVQKLDPEIGEAEPADPDAVASADSGSALSDVLIEVADHASEPAMAASHATIEPDETPRAKEAPLPNVEESLSASGPALEREENDEASATVAELPTRNTAADKRSSRPMSKFVGGAETDAAISLMLHEDEAHNSNLSPSSNLDAIQQEDVEAVDAVSVPLLPALDLTGITNQPSVSDTIAASPEANTARQTTSPSTTHNAASPELSASDSDQALSAGLQQEGSQSTRSPPSKARTSRSTSNMRSPPLSASSRRAIDVQRREASASSAMTPSNSGPSVSSSPQPPSPQSANSRQSGSGFDASLSPAHSSGSLSNSSATKKSRFSLAKFGKGKNEKVNSPLTSSTSAGGKDSFFGSVGRGKSPISEEKSFGSAVSREERMQKTLSQILRDADAAMADLENDNDAASIISKDDGLSWEGDDDNEDDGAQDFDVKIPA